MKSRTFNVQTVFSDNETALYGPYSMLLYSMNLECLTTMSHGRNAFVSQRAAFCICGGICAVLENSPCRAFGRIDPTFPTEIARKTPKKHKIESELNQQ